MCTVGEIWCTLGGVYRTVGGIYRTVGEIWCTVGEFQRGAPTALRQAVKDRTGARLGWTSQGQGCTSVGRTTSEMRL